MIINEQISQALANNYEVWLDHLQELSSNEDDIEYTRTVLEYACDTSFNYLENAHEVEKNSNSNYGYYKYNKNKTFDYGYGKYSNYGGENINDSKNTMGVCSCYEVIYYYDTIISRIISTGNGYDY